MNAETGPPGEAGPPGLDGFCPENQCITQEGQPGQPGAPGVPGEPGADGAPGVVDFCQAPSWYSVKHECLQDLALRVVCTAGWSTAPDSMLAIGCTSAVCNH